MSLVLVFGRDDPARVRFAISPVWETMAALRVLLEPQRRKYHLPWLEAVRPDLERLDLWPLLVLSPRSGWTPDFLSPGPAGPGLRKSGVHPLRGDSTSSGQRSRRSRSGRTASSQGRWYLRRCGSSRTRRAAIVSHSGEIANRTRAGSSRPKTRTRLIRGTFALFGLYRMSSL